MTRRDLENILSVASHLSVVFFSLAGVVALFSGGVGEALPYVTLAYVIGIWNRTVLG